MQRADASALGLFSLAFLFLGGRLFFMKCVNLTILCYAEKE